MVNSILFLTNAYPDFDASYRGIFIKKMAYLLEKGGYRISVVTPKIFKKSRFFEKQEGIHIYRFPFFSGNKPLIEYKTVPYFRMMLYFISGILLALYSALKNRCSLIHAHWAIPTGLIGVFVGAILRKPLIVTIHGSDLRIATEKPGLLRRLFLFVCHKALHINCVSDVQKQEIEKLGIESRKISVIPMGVDEDFFEVGKKRRADSIVRPFTVVSNRNLQPNYNISLLIRAIPIILKEEPATRFIIAGSGPERKSLEGEVETLNVKPAVRFLGSIPHERMPDLLSQADIYISTSFSDGTSVSLLEAMAAGAYPVVTDISSNQEWISEGENGFLFPPGNETVLAQKVVGVIRNPGLLSKASEKNRKIAEQKAYMKNNVKKVTEIYLFSTE